MKNYEGMFLFDPAVLTDWDSVQKEVYRILERAGAQVVVCSRWDERRLAYEIKGRKRGIYALVYFKAEPGKIAGIERDITLSETALRCLIIKVEMTDEEMKEAGSTTRIEQQKNAGFEGDDEGGEGDSFRRRPPFRRGPEEHQPAEVVPAAEPAREE